MFDTVANVVIQGILLGGLFSLFALGLSFSMGVMRFVNIAHGDFIVLVSFLLLVLTTSFGLNVFVALILVLPIAFVGGFLLQRFLLQRASGSDVLLPLLITFGLSIIIQNGLLQGFGADSHVLSGAGSLQTASIALSSGIYIGVLPLLTLIVAIALVIGLDMLLNHSRLGAHIRAVADDVSAANLIGLSSGTIYALAMGLVGITVAVAACFMGLNMNFDPTSGPDRLLIAFEAVVLGGLGSLWGTLAGGIVLGIAQTVGGHFDIAWQLIVGHLVFLVLFLLRPQGLFPKY